MKKKFSLNMDDGRVVSVEVNGKVYNDVADIPDDADRDLLDSLVFFASDAEKSDQEKAAAGQPSRLFPRAILGVFLGVALLMLGITVFSAVRISGSVARELAAAGRVVDVIGQAGSGDTTYYYPIVEFTTADETRQTVQVGPGSSPPAYRVGDAVTVRYDPARPESARIATLGSNLDQFILPIITGVLAVAFLIATAFAWWILKSD
jgi:hypothetical protein